MGTLFADLHIHTTFSDGTFSPAECIKYAQKIGLTTVSITDHDTTDGLPEAINEGSKRGIEVIPGIELSAEVKNSYQQELHILGYFINWENGAFQQKLELFAKTREQRAYQILEKLKNLGITLDEKRLFEIAGIGIIGRLHFARALVEKKIVKNNQEAFYKYLGEGKPAYVPKFRLLPVEAIKMILKVGGIPILAHPHFNKINFNFIKSLIKSGLKGIEVWHTSHSAEESKQLKKMTDKLGVLSTGGSDCHGPMPGVPAIMGRVKVPYSAVIKLKEYKNSLTENQDKIFE
ncbi:MAG: PHP domain-containing protein [Elusimicrobia bacterium]|nr:PHP domain-containing protein [Elusimicrobiota bacterium]